MPLRKLIWILMAVALSFTLATFTSAQEGYRPDPIRGGQLYDNWFALLSTLPPEGDHPLWGTQEFDLRSGTVTWRCSTCHGWDYKGDEGVLFPGSPYYTGFPGTLRTVGLTNEAIASWLDGTKNPDHDFSELIDRNSLGDLIAFLRTKQVDVALIVDYQTQASLGLRRDGQDLYIQNCMICHGLDGGALNFRDANNPEFVADVALYDPWRFIHKVRFGGSFSPDHDYETREWSLQNIADLLAFTQALPPGSEPLEQDPVPTPASPQQSLEDQGDLGGVVIASFLIVLVIMFGLGWSYLNNR
ncbi:MAG: cytochrome c [Anaerolineae bacterium]|nr:cytochrome c [Anaerolineae bacterium]